ncbi:MAG: HAMP domain-containing histidine kinase [Mageeibacillus sp.]|nr:HAMP domain-containing histidine kinase [Mageeibacillus sp.]
MLMTERTGNRTRPLRNKAAIRIPISLHFYSSLILVILLVVLTINFYIQSIVQNYIANECESRLENAVTSCQTFAQAFRSQIDDTSGMSSEDIRTYLLNSIVSAANLSNQANISLYTLDDKEAEDFTLLWPTSDYSVSYVNTTNKVIENVIKEKGYENLNTTQTTVLDNNLIYYRTIGVEYSPNENVVSDVPNYYLLIYVNSNTYYSFMAEITMALIQATLLSLIIAGFMSIGMTYPLLFSTRKLSKFAGRIAKGDFTPIKGHIVSKELSELGDVMNQMAYKLDESDIEQKTFFQNASHELRTPLMSIQGYAEGIKCGVFEDKESKENAVDVIIAETQRLSNLVENLLSISKMDMSKSGNYEVKKQNIDVEKLCETVIDRVRGNFIHEDKAIINDIRVQSVYIFANESDILRCFENIFSNCLRYCKTSVTLSCVTDEESRNVIFSISDDGAGISEEVSEHLFERFTKGSDGKHGIGLALAKAIVEEHNGTIKGYNRPEGGARFDITLPTVTCKQQITKINNDRN